MPELPEVETIRRGLEKPITGQTINGVEVRLSRLLLGMKAPDLIRTLRGQTIGAILRRGKYLVLELDSDTLIIHLGMTGQLTHAPARAKEDSRFYRTVTGLQKSVGVHPVDAHTHVILFLGDGSRLQFRDPRTFGKIIFIRGHAWRNHVRLRKLGPEPLDLNIAAFLEELVPTSSRRPIKAWLLDQTFLAGVGNIYADEALFAAKLHPRRSANSLTRENWQILLQEIKKVLRKGIRNRGTTFSDYRQPDGKLGHNYEHLQAYGRGDQPCLRCGTLLVKTLVAQRGTVFCPECQRLKAS